MDSYRHPALCILGPVHPCPDLLAARWLRMPYPSFLFNNTDVGKKASDLLWVTEALIGETRPRPQNQDTQLIESTPLQLRAFKFSVNIVPSMGTSLWLQILLFIFTPAFLLLLARSEQMLYVCYYFQRGVSQECPLPTF